MTAGPSAELQHALSAEAMGLLGLTPRTARLLSAVHEAGHAVVADTVGLRVARARVASAAHIGVGGDHVDVETRDGADVPPGAHLVVLAAGFQASYTWAVGRGYTDPAKLNRALNILNGGDRGAVDALRERHGRPDIHIQQGTEPAMRILTRRWSTVLRIAYALARAGELDERALFAHLVAGPAELQAAARRVWREWPDPFTTPSVPTSATTPGA
ncbi:hypothetical protein ACU686_26440 [Yinghuangia aomiensis]